ncbi:MAG: serine/threonine protein kinase [Clostridiaceae bacterium]|nr:serine/threonine protein kinase [Clostridiaceae bacterium]
MMKDRIIADKYRIIDFLGEGGTSAVYLAENIVLNNFWAIKVLYKNSPRLSVDMEEIDILKNLSHPMLPRIADLTEDEDNYYIVMDYIPGSNLLKVLEYQGKIPEKTLLKWTRDLLDVLKYLHSRNPPIIYGDLKPANLIVDDIGQLRLVDFGAARYYTKEKTEDTVYIGTQGYAAPEQYGVGQTDQRTDLYSLGMTIFHLATGIHPVKQGSEKLKDVLKKAGIAQRYIHFILKLAQTDPGKRFQNCEEAIEELGRMIIPERLFFYNRKAEKSFKGVIAIASLLPASGVTSLCLAIGKYLSSNKVSSVLVELNSSGDFDRMREYLDELGEVKLQSENRFEANNLVFYPNAPDFGVVSRKGIDAIILDLGQLNTERKMIQFNHADIRIIVCPNVPWKYSLFSECHQKIESLAKEEWIYTANISQSYEHQKLKKLLGSNRLVLYSTVSNPFYLNTEDHKRIGVVLNEICKLAGQL